MDMLVRCFSAVVSEINFVPGETVLVCWDEGTRVSSPTLLTCLNLTLRSKVTDEALRQ